MLKDKCRSKCRKITEVVTIGPPLMMRAVSDMTMPYGVKTVASLNSIMVDATGICGACVDGPELDSHIIDWDKFLPRPCHWMKSASSARPSSASNYKKRSGLDARQG
jgi:glutamate synthase (NADPH/NADH) small chain